MKPLRALIRKLRTNRQAPDPSPPAWHSLLVGHGLEPSRPPRRVAVVTGRDEAAQDVAGLVPPGARSVEVLPGGVDRARERMKRVGPVDLLVDAADDGATLALARWRELFGHVQRNGHYVISGSRTTAELEDWVPHIGEREATWLAASVGEVVTGRDALVLTQSFTHRLKVRDAEAADVLAEREPALRVTELHTVRGGRFTSHARVVHHPQAPVDGWPSAEIDYPVLHLRRYEGTIAFHGGTLMYAGNSILPDSFRWHASDDPRNPKAINAGPSFARVPRETWPNRSRPGSFYQLDPQYGGFGHVLTEVVGRLWGWDRAKESDPELKAVFWVDRPENYRNVPKYQVLRGWGIADDDIVAVNKDTYLRSMTSGTVMWHNAAPYYAHPDLRGVWSRLGDGLVAPGAPTHDKIFVSRSGEFGRRWCHNKPEVEARFAAAGFAVVYPEQLDLGEQVALFRNARVIAGFGGSALFNMMFCDRLERLIVLTHEAYFHRNEHLFTGLLGGEVHYFWSTPDVTEPDPSNPYAQVESSWSFDFARLGAALDRVLQS